MESLSFALSGRGLGDVAAYYEKDFVFVVGGVEYRCCRCQAIVVSGLVRRLLASDCCVSRVCLKVNDDMGGFKDVMDLMHGGKISITQANMSFLEACARELENDELLDSIMSFYLKDDISMSNVLDRIRIKTGCHSDYKSELDFLAQHFFQLDIEILRHLSVSNLELLLTNPLLKLESEDQLYDVILSLIQENGDDYRVLFRYVEFVFLSQLKRNEFLELVFPDLVDITVWESVRSMVLHSNRPDINEIMTKATRYTLTFTSDQGAFMGICRYLEDKCCGNPHEKGIIRITTTAQHCERNHPEQLIDSGRDGFTWFSRNEPNSFLQFDFQSIRVCLSQYSIRSDGYGVGHLMSWVIEVSDDGLKWETIDQKQKTRDLNGQFIVKTYEITKQSERFVRFVRLRQTGKNSDNQNHLRLSRIEFFGKITWGDEV